MKILQLNENTEVRIGDTGVVITQHNFRGSHTIVLSTDEIKKMLEETDE